MQDMKNVWSVFDLEMKDQVSVVELGAILRALDIDLEDEELDIIRKQVDPDESGFITFANLNVVMEDKLKEVDTIDELKDMFALLDKEGTGTIQTMKFKSQMMSMGSKMNADEVEEILKEADPRGDGYFTIAEFCERLCPPKKWLKYNYINY